MGAKILSDLSCAEKKRKEKIQKKMEKKNPKKEKKKNPKKIEKMKK
jgi:hypothetical protein